MKKVLIIIAAIIAVPLYSQTLANELSLASKDFEAANKSIFLPITLNLQYYSKNYKSVFGEYNFTLDSSNFGVRNVYIGHDNKFYYQNNSTFIMDMQPSGLNSLNFTSNADYLGGLYSAFTLLFNNKADYLDTTIRIR